MNDLFYLINYPLQLDSYEIAEGKNLKLNVSEPKTRLFLGNIPKSKGKEEIEDEMRKLTGKLPHKLLGLKVSSSAGIDVPFSIRRRLGKWYFLSAAATIKNCCVITIATTYSTN